MTDKEIIKALEYCFTNDWNRTKCDKCAFYTGTTLCVEDLKSAIINLINRQQTEIERLKVENKKVKLMVEAIDDYINPLPFKTDFDNAIENAKSEAVKEFAERLKNDLFYKCGDLNYTETCDTRRLIDNLVKEMVGENNGI